MILKCELRYGACGDLWYISGCGRLDWLNLVFMSIINPQWLLFKVTKNKYAWCFPNLSILSSWFKAIMKGKVCLYEGKYVVMLMYCNNLHILYVFLYHINDMNNNIFIISGRAEGLGQEILQRPPSIHPSVCPSRLVFAL